MATRGVTGWPTGSTVSVSVYDITAANLDVDWTSVGIGTRANGEGISNYWYSVSAIPGHAYDVQFKDDSDPPLTAGFILSEGDVNISLLYFDDGDSLLRVHTDNSVDIGSVNTTPVNGPDAFKSDVSGLAKPGDKMNLIDALIDNGFVKAIMEDVTDAMRTARRADALSASMNAIGNTYADYTSQSVAGRLEILNTLAGVLNGMIEHISNYYRFKAHTLEEAPSSDEASINPQDVRDALALALSNGVIPASGSIDVKLDAIDAPTFTLPVMQGQIYTATAIQGKTVRIVRQNTARITFQIKGDYSAFTATFGAEGVLPDYPFEYALESKACSSLTYNSGTDSTSGYVDLTSDDTCVDPGMYECEILFTDGGTRQTAMLFKLKILDNVIDK